MKKRSYAPKPEEMDRIRNLPIEKTADNVEDAFAALMYSMHAANLRCGLRHEQTLRWLLARLGSFPHWEKAMRDGAVPFNENIVFARETFAHFAQRVGGQKD